MGRPFLNLILCAAAASAQAAAKTESALYPAATVAEVQANIAGDPWAASVRDRVVEAAQYWRDLDDETLWGFMFGPNISRSWMVWSNGHSPVTGEPVPMYNWVHDAKNHPWKVQDPTSGEWFPKNDFKAFHDSGLDDKGIFQPALADRSLLFNTEHPDPNDPLHLFGVDDGEGYVNEKGERWRFIGAYLIYGQWKQLIVSGARVLGAAYVLTGDPVYARKAAILLDRAADIYPTMDFKTQGVMYEGEGTAGYVSTWHDACEETRELVMAYDMIYEGIENDQELVAFLSAKAADLGLENPKASIADIRRNIEAGILRDALANPAKIYSNYPRTEVCKAIITAVLQEPDDAFWAIVDPMIEKATAVDGVTGEKGLAGYSSYTISGMASFLSEFSRSDPEFLPALLERFPNLRGTYRFFMDTLCLGRYYPLIGDTGHYGAALDRYIGVDFTQPGTSITGGLWTILSPSNYRLFWRFYEATGDPGYVQIMYAANGGTSAGMPYDIFRADGAVFRKQVDAVIAREGTLLHNTSVNKEQWRLAILRSGRGSNERALWLDYDAGGGHGHQDGMNLGLFAHGLDFMPEMGYPPVQFGGWTSDRAKWYTKTAAHNTVLVDGANQAKGDGETTLWMDGGRVHAIRAEGAEMAGAERYERTAMLVDIDDERFYVVDVFRVAGGAWHLKFQQSHFGALTTEGLDLAEAERFPEIAEMRNHKLDPNPTPGWHADWAAEDLGKLLSDSVPRGMRYRDFTEGAAAGTSEAWIIAAMYDGGDERWLPRIAVERRSETAEPLASTFASLVEPWKGEPSIADVKRLPGAADEEVIFDIALPDGRRDLVLLRDPKAGQGAITFGAPAVTTDAEIAVIRFAADGTIEHAAIAHGTYIESGAFALRTVPGKTFAEFNGK